MLLFSDRSGYGLSQWDTTLQSNDLYGLMAGNGVTANRLYVIMLITFNSRIRHIFYTFKDGSNTMLF